jgi:hypothetical protein
VGTGVHKWEGTNLRVMVADRPYGEFYDFYSVSPEYFGCHHVNTVFFWYVMQWSSANKHPCF